MQHSLISDSSLVADVFELVQWRIGGGGGGGNRH